MSGDTGCPGMRAVAMESSERLWLTEEAEAVRLDDGRNVQGGGKRGRGRWEESQCLGLGYN